MDECEKLLRELVECVGNLPNTITTIKTYNVYERALEYFRRKSHQSEHTP